jgi:hypothetical protein
MILSWLNQFVVGVVFSRARDRIGSRLPESPGGARSTERPRCQLAPKASQSGALVPLSLSSYSVLSTFALAIGVLQRHPVAAIWGTNNQQVGKGRHHAPRSRSGGASTYFKLRCSKSFVKSGNQKWACGPRPLVSASCARL